MYYIYWKSNILIRIILRIIPSPFLLLWANAGEDDKTKL